MKKFIMGLLVGVGIASSFNAYAAIESLIGKEVQGEVNVKLNGSTIGNKAAIVDGSSYLPVRAIGEALGLNVDFQNSEVILNQKPIEVKQPVTESTNNQTTPTTTPAPERKLNLDQIEGKIEQTKINIQGLKMVIEAGGGTTNPQYKEYSDRLAKYETELTDLEKQKAELQIQK